MPGSRAPRKASATAVVWRQPDGAPVACEEKLKVLNENLDELRQMIEDAYEDALLIGCDEEQVKAVFTHVVQSLRNPFDQN